MSNDSMSISVRVRLSAMMFLQYMLFAVWWVPLAAYLNSELGVTGTQLSLILSSMAFGCLASPIIGAIADRHFASQHVLAVLNLLGGLLLAWAAMQTEPTMMFVAILLQTLCYMPTWGLTSSIAMANSSSEAFPQIRVFGSIGWVASGGFSLVAMWMFQTKIDGTVIPLYCGAATSIVAAVLSLTLPHTPPPAKGQPASLVDILGLRAMGLMKDFSFAVFIIVSLLTMIPFSIYWSYCSLFLNDQGFQLITVTMNFGQFAEMFFMVLIPLALARMGIKWALTVGLVALVIRYIAFLLGGMYDQTWLYAIAILVHGLIFGFFFVGGQIYIDRKAPKEIRAQAQGFIFLVTFGLGLLIGNFINGELISRNSTTSLAVAEDFQPSAGASIAADMITANDAMATDVRIYDRILNDTEIAVLSASETKAKNLVTEAEEQGISVQLEEGLVYTGDSSGLPTESVPGTFTLAGSFTFGEQTEGQAVNGTLLRIGDDGDAVELALRDNLLVLQAGEKEILARTVSVPFGKSEDGADQPLHVAASFDGTHMTLYTGGTPYRMYAWTPIWAVTTGFSVALLLILVLLFHVRVDESKPSDDKETDDDSETGTSAPPGD